MGKLLYNLSILLYGATVRLISPFNEKAKKWMDGRNEWKSNLTNAVGKLDAKKPVVWFHASSLGEFEQGRPVMEALKKTKNISLVLSFFSPSGYEVIKNWPAADLICYLPIDTKKNAVNFINIINPSIVIFIKYEFWYHYLNQLNKQQIKTYLISARFYPGQLFFKSWAKWYRKMLFLFNKIYVQEKNSKDLLTGIGYHSVKLAGDTRYDRVDELSRNTDEFPEIKSFVNNEPLFIAGSSWPIGEALICEYINQYPEKYKYLIAPHDISENHLRKIEKQLNVPFQRYSDYQETIPTSVLILDTIGMLSRVYKYATVAYIGGAFKEGLHNILEPAAYGVPVITGPDHSGFPEGPEMEKAGGLVRVHDFTTFEEVMNRWINRVAHEPASNAVQRFIQTRKGATQKIVEDLIRVINLKRWN